MLNYYTNKVALVAAFVLSAGAVHAQGSPASATNSQPAAAVPLPVPDTIKFDWRTLPVLDPLTGKFNAAIIFVSNSNGAPIADRALRIVIGRSSDLLTDPLIENANLKTDANGLATFQNATVKGEARPVFLAVRTLEGAHVSVPIPFAFGPVVADEVVLVQVPAASVENGALLGTPSVIVKSHGVPLKDAIVVANRIAGNASLSKAEAKTDENGIASFSDLRATGKCPAQNCGSVDIQFISGKVSTAVTRVLLQTPTVAKLSLLPGAPTETASGGLVPVFTVHATSAENLPVAAFPVTVRTAGGLPLAQVLTEANGDALFDSVRVYGAIGGANLIIAAGSERVLMPLAVRTGLANRIEIIGQPPIRVAYDSLLAPSTRLRVTDVSGNPVAGALVRASVCVHKLIRIRDARAALAEEINTRPNVRAD